MGEGWSDWYAKDFLVAQFPALDTAASGDVDMGTYTDATPHSIRTQGARLPGRRVGGVCPARRRGRLRRLHVRRLRQESRTARRCTPTARSGPRRCGTCAPRSARATARAADHRRHAALAAGAVVPGRAQRDPARRPGRRAAAVAQRDLGRVRARAGWATSRRPTTRRRRRRRTSRRRRRPATRAGRSPGTITDTATGARAPGREGRDRRARGRSGRARRRRRGGDGSYAIDGRARRARYPSLSSPRPGYDSVLTPVTVPAGATATRRPGAARATGPRCRAARPSRRAGSDEYADQGCGPDAALDQCQGSGVVHATRRGPGSRSSSRCPRPSTSTELRGRPGARLRRRRRSATRDYRIETSPTSADGPWTPPRPAPFVDADRHRLNAVPPRRPPRPPRAGSRCSARRAAATSST